MKTAVAARRDVDSIWKKYLVGKPIKLRNLLVEHYRPLVHMMAARLAQKLPAQISYDEICSAGYDGLMEAVQAYRGRLAAVGLEEIQDAIWRYLDPDHCALGILRGDETTP